MDLIGCLDKKGRGDTHHKFLTNEARIFWENLQHIREDQNV